MTGVRQGGFDYTQPATAGYAPEPAIPPEEERHLTLGLPALLVVFFALALACGVFFGWGYSTGRGHLRAEVKGAPATVAGETAAVGSVTPVAKPSPVAQAAPEVGSEEETPAETQAPIAAASVRAAAPHAVAPAPAEAAAPTSGPYVQVAAVARATDAQALAGALRRKGFGVVVVRRVPGDNFLHVQLGPFATRDEARAALARLGADGYPAFIRQ